MGLFQPLTIRGRPLSCFTIYHFSFQFHFISFRFVSFRFVSFRFVSFHFISSQLPWLHCVSFPAPFLTSFSHIANEQQDSFHCGRQIEDRTDRDRSEMHPHRTAKRALKSIVAFESDPTEPSHFANQFRIAFRAVASPEPSPETGVESSRVESSFKRHACLLSNRHQSNLTTSCQTGPTSDDDPFRISFLSLLSLLSLLPRLNRTNRPPVNCVCSARVKSDRVALEMTRANCRFTRAVLIGDKRQMTQIGPPDVSQSITAVQCGSHFGHFKRRLHRQSQRPAEPDAISTCVAVAIGWSHRGMNRAGCNRWSMAKRHAVRH